MKEDKTEIFETETRSGKHTISIDDNGNLYINDKRVITETVITLGRCEKIAVIIGGASTGILSLIELYKLITKG